ncbi:hypothetical protein VIGAN_09113900, partial [Vigna angularis var. angularis]
DETCWCSWCIRLWDVHIQFGYCSVIRNLALYSILVVVGRSIHHGWRLQRSNGRRFSPTRRFSGLRSSASAKSSTEGGQCWMLSVLCRQPNTFLWHHILRDFYHSPEGPFLRHLLPL